jgi:alanine racemase
MSRLDKPDHSQNDRQISLFYDLRRLFGGIPASVANSSDIFFGAKAHFDLVRAVPRFMALIPCRTLSI